MTLIVATKRPSFAVLAAEQFHGGVTRVYAPKVVLHRDSAIPLAFAVAGTPHLLLGGRAAPVTEHLLGFANSIKSANELELGEVARRLKELLSPGVQEKKCETGVFVALARKGVAAAGLLHLAYQAGGVTSTLHSECPQWCPGEIGAAFDARDWGLLHDPGNMDPDSVADQARRLVQKGIDYDEQLHSGRHESCGGKVDVVIVDSAGARQS
jgi:hypothetical protein